MTDDDLVISVSPTGELNFIYSDELVGLVDQAKTYQAERVSNVEPVGKDWFVFMKDGPAQAGPFRRREDALDWEKKYLEEKMFR